MIHQYCTSEPNYHEFGVVWEVAMKCTMISLIWHFPYFPDFFIENKWDVFQKRISCDNQFQLDFGKNEQSPETAISEDILGIVC